jgi:hypothetical protein
LKNGIIKRIGHVFIVTPSERRRIVFMNCLFRNAMIAKRIQVRGIMSNCPWNAVMRSETGLMA